MNIKILYDSESSDAGLASGWGFSCLVNNHVLFDTGESSELLRQNIKKMKIDPSAFESVVLSHDHWDHVGGLEYIVSKKKKVKIYICSGFDFKFKNDILSISKKIIKSDHFQRVSSCIYTTGQITGFYKEKVLAEQALILQTDKGFSVITGCAHPGIIKMLERIKSQLSLKEFYAVIGGFHLKDHAHEDAEKIVDEFVRLKVKNVVPLHCTGSDAAGIFQEKYGKNCFVLKAGEEMEV